MRRGGDPNGIRVSPSGARVPLVLQAVWNDNLPILRALIAAKADVRARMNGNGQSPLESATIDGKLEMVKLLLQAGADVNEVFGDRLTPLSLAARAKRYEVAAHMIDAGARVDLEAANGLRPIHWAANANDLRIVRLLLHSGADPNLRTTPAWTEQLHSAVKADVHAVLESALRGSQTSSAAASSPARVAAPAWPESPKPAFREPERDNRFALVIGIENYDSLPKADHAARDAKAMNEHLLALGVPRRNIIHLENQKAGRSSFEKFLNEWLPRNVKAGGEVFFYFSGHGAPDPESGESYLVPWDGDPAYLKSTAMPLKTVYAALAKLPAERVVVALDSCFSGAGGRSVLAKGARPLVARRSTAPLPARVTVLTASDGAEISGALDEQGHGLFTYFLLKGLSEGKRSAKALHEYLKPRVQDEARRQNREQTPQLLGEDATL